MQETKKVPFKIYYSQTISPALQSLESKRRLMLKVTIISRITITVFLAFFFAFVIGMLRQSDDTSLFLKIVLGFMGLVMFLVAYYLFQNILRVFPNVRLTAAMKWLLFLLVFGTLLGATSSLYQFLAVPILQFPNWGQRLGRFFIWFTGMAAVVFPLGFWLRMHERSFSTRYRSVLIPLLLRYLTTRYTYEADGKTSEETLSESGYFSLRYRNRFTLTHQDHLMISNQGREVEIIQLNVYYSNSSVKSTSGNAIDREIFNGIFATGKITPPLSGSIRMQSKESNTSALSEILSSADERKEQEHMPVETGDESLQTQWNINATNPIMAIRFLTEERRDILKRISRQWGYDTVISFVNGKWFMKIALDPAEDRILFSPSVFNPLDDIESVEKYLSQLQLLISLQKLG